MDRYLLATLAGTALLAILMACAALLRAWQGWLELRRIAVKGQCSAPAREAAGELASLRERVRKLEAIASGVDLKRSAL